MIAVAWAVFRNSLPLQLVALALAGWAALAANNVRQQWVGAEKLTAKIERKADANAEIATEVRTHVDSGKRGKPDPHLRPSRLQ
jgi:hypothetical protein